MKMKTKHVIFMLSSCVGVCMIAMSVLGFKTWNLSQELKRPTTEGAFSSKDFSLDVLSVPGLKKNDFWASPWDQSGGISQLSERMGELLNSMSSGISTFSQQTFASTALKYHKEDKPDQYEIIVEVPEGQEIELNTELRNNQLTISGKVKSELKTLNGAHSSQIFQSSQFSQSIYLPEPVDEAGMQIDHKPNQIIIAVPKT